MSIRRCWFFLLGLPGLLGAFAGAASAQTLTFVDAAGRPASFYLESTRVYVQVEDPAANSPGTVNTVPVTLQADLSGDQEILQLTETGEDTGLFQGFMDLRTGPGLPGDGRLETTADGPPYRFDTVHATYTGGGGGAPAMATAQMLGSLTSFIDSYGNEVTSYAAGQPVRVRVEDHNVDDPGRFDSVAATVQSLGSGDAENLQLQELTKSGGLFEASLPMERNAPAAQNDGRLQASAGEALRAMHTDANGLLASGAQANVDFLTLSFLDESGRPTTEVLESGTARVRVVSAQDNANPFAVDQVQVQLHTQYAGDQEFLTLTETGPDTGVFEGGIPLNLAPVAGNNGTLETQRSGPPDFLPEQITADAGPISATAHTVASRVLFIDGFGRQTSSFPVGGPVGVRVVEPARNFDRQQRETTFIQLQVPGDQETVTLFETGFNTGIFEGTIGSDRGGAQPNDGRLEGQAGQAIFASYQNVTTPNPTLAQALFTGGQVSFVDASGRPTSVYLVGTRARVRVEDHGADVRSWIEDTVVVTVTADLSGDVENLTLTETGPNTGVFEAEVQLREGPAQPGDGVLETREESGPPHEFDTLHASYTTGDGGVSTAQAGTLSFRVWFIDAFGNVVSSYPQGTRTYVRIEDHRFNDPGVFDRI
ncbi:MAG: large repetitive protein, partial [Acidobacteriota bacterium]|nr:large repetitive protein [Acidobacteriota bacterium]